MEAAVSSEQSIRLWVTSAGQYGGYIHEQQAFTNEGARDITVFFIIFNKDNHTHTH